MPKYTMPVSSGPNAIRGGGEFTVTGTTYAAIALSDASDATYCKVSSGPVLPVDMLTSWPTVGAGERIVSVVPSVRSKQPGAKTCRAAVTVYGGISISFLYEGAALSLPTGVNVATDYELAASAGQQLVPGLAREWGYQFSQSDYSRPGIAFYEPHTASANWATWYKASLAFFTLKPATVASPTTPSGTVTTTQYPQVGAVASAVVESWQEISGGGTFMGGVDAELRIYAGTHTSPPAAPTLPLAAWIERTMVTTYIDGSTPTTKAIVATPPVALPNGAMTVFVRVSRDHPSGRPAWSAWAYKQWTQNVPAPATPTLTVTKSDAAQRMQVQVNAAATAGYDSSSGEVEVQRRLAGGGWRDVRGMNGVAITIGSTVTVGYDLEADRGIANTYRARASMWHTVDGVRRYSAWATVAETGPAAGTWNLKAVELPGSSWLDVMVAERPEEASQAPSALLEPLDRERPVVLLGVLGGFSGQLAVFCSGATQIAALKALEAYRGLVYLEDAFGEARWIAITRVSWERGGTAASPWRRATIDYAETDSGLAVYDS